MNSRVAVGLLLLLAAITYSAWLLVLFLPTGLSLVDGYVSELGASGQRFQALFRETDMISGAALMVSAPLLMRVLPSGWGGKIVACSVLVFGLTVLLGAIFSLDCASSMSELCRQQVESGEVSPAHHVHVVSSVFADISIFTAILGAQAVAFGRSRHLLRVVAVIVAVTGLDIVMLDSRGPGHGVGLILEIQLVVVGATMLAVARFFLRKQPQPIPPVPDATTTAQLTTQSTRFTARRFLRSSPAQRKSA